MTAAEKVGTAGTLITQNIIEQFLYREARYLDDREFEKWLQCYADDVVYWMPSSHVEVIERRDDLVDVRFNWHTMYFRYKTIDPYYGTSFYTIDFSGEQPLIRRKTVVLKNDYIHHVVDVYHF